MSTEVHPLSALVVGNDNRRYGGHVPINQRFKAVSNWIVWMKDIVELWTCWQNKVDAESINTAHRHKHSYKKSKYKITM